MAKAKYHITKIDFFDSVHTEQSLSLLKKVFIHGDFTPEWWRWKYRDNPFGEPLGWIAIASRSEKIIGIRLFWPWVFELNGEKKLFYQAVDTATDPDFQKKGIFSSLIKIALNDMFKRNVCIYNFPNDISYPAYIKFKWNEIGNNSWVKIPIISLSTFTKLNIPNIRHGNTYSILSNYSVVNNNICIPSFQNYFSTCWTNQIVQWRFGRNPYCKYYYYVTGNGQVIFKIRKVWKLNEAQLVVTNMKSPDFLGDVYDFFRRNCISLISFNALNSPFYNVMIKKCIKIKTSHKIRFVIKNCSKEDSIKNIKLEPGEMDYL
jgi:GNAT superfamily N-acetyltransferase